MINSDRCVSQFIPKTRAMGNTVTGKRTKAAIAGSGECCARATNGHAAAHSHFASDAPRTLMRSGRDCHTL
jgi:hypothetical protein